MAATTPTVKSSEGNILQAVSFLKNERVVGTPTPKKVAFLRDTKKMSLVEISEAFKRAYPQSSEWQKIAAGDAVLTAVASTPSFVDSPIPAVPSAVTASDQSALHYKIPAPLQGQVAPQIIVIPSPYPPPPPQTLPVPPLTSNSAGSSWWQPYGQAAAVLVGGASAAFAAKSYIDHSHQKLFDSLRDSNSLPELSTVSTAPAISLPTELSRVSTSNIPTARTPFLSAPSAVPAIISDITTTPIVTASTTALRSELNGVREELGVLAQLMRLQSAEMREAIGAFRVQNTALAETLQTLNGTMRSLALTLAANSTTPTTAITDKNINDKALALQLLTSLLTTHNSLPSGASVSTDTTATEMSALKSDVSAIKSLLLQHPPSTSTITATPDATRILTPTHRDTTSFSSGSYVDAALASILPTQTPMSTLPVGPNSVPEAPAPVKVGEEFVTRALSEGFAVIGQTTADDVKYAMQTLSLYLKNICENPSNITYRRLSQTNPRLKKCYEKFPQFETILIAMGFVSRGSSLEWSPTSVGCPSDDPALLLLRFALTAVEQARIAVRVPTEPMQPIVTPTGVETTASTSAGVDPLVATISTVTVDTPSEVFGGGLALSAAAVAANTPGN